LLRVQGTLYQEEDREGDLDLKCACGFERRPIRQDGHRRAVTYDPSQDYVEFDLDLTPRRNASSVGLLDDVPCKVRVLACPKCGTLKLKTN
jgi:hypothetical protein